MSTSDDPSEISEFYLACRRGDVKFVKDHSKDLLKTNSDPNYVENSIKSTPLHTASYHGHREIVQILLELDCDRSLTNAHGITAYEVAANDEIRHLYKRPTSSSVTPRFLDEGTDGCFEIVQRPEGNNEEPTTPTVQSPTKPKNTTTIYSYETDAEKQLEAGYAATSIAMCQSKFGRLIADIVQPGAPMSLTTMGQKLQAIIDEQITARQDPHSKKANELLNRFLNDVDRGRVEHLIRLYTLETCFYHALRDNPIPLALPLYIAAESMKDRYFQGRSYRGAKIDDDEIAAYEWAANNPGSLLQARHFSSTSTLQSIAEEFLSNGSKNKHGIERKPALFIFNFPKISDQTINLRRISREHPCLSEFEDEAEILILPWTLFQVDLVKKESSSSPYIISLTNVLLPHTSMWSSLKWILTHPKGSIHRFHEHFPEKKPETVVRELMDTFPIADERF